jgi:hypothetical protein
MWKSTPRQINLRHFCILDIKNAFLSIPLNKYVVVPRRLFFAAQQRIAITLSPNYYQKMQPAYGYIALALVKCSNEGGPGPRYNMKEDPGYSILSMLVVHGYHLYLMPLFSDTHAWISFNFFYSVLDTQSKDRLATKNVLTKQYFSRTMFCSSIHDVGIPWFTIEPFPF